MTKEEFLLIDLQVGDKIEINSQNSPHNFALSFEGVVKNI
jgi:hypothetical protein